MSQLIVILTVVGNVLLLFILYFCLRQKKHRDSHDSHKLSSPLQGSSANQEAKLEDSALEVIRIQHTEIVLKSVLSSSEFGEVWFGSFGNIPVAVKRALYMGRELHLEAEETIQMVDSAFRDQIKRMPRFSHPNIATFLGVSWTTKLDTQAVAEFIDCGDLQAVLSTDTSYQFSWKKEKLRIALDVARALNCLHTKYDTTHLDLKSRNVLVDSWVGAKLSAFGIFKCREFQDTLPNSPKSWRWKSPEVLSCLAYSHLSDIFSFGVILSELDTLSSPYKDENIMSFNIENEILYGVIDGSLKPQFSPSCPEYIHILAVRCLEVDASLRPSASEIISILETD